MRLSQQIAQLLFFYFANILFSSLFPLLSTLSFLLILALHLRIGVISRKIEYHFAVLPTVEFLFAVVIPAVSTRM